MQNIRHGSAGARMFALAIVALFVVPLGRETFAAGPKASQRPLIYDTKADGEKQIADALVKAKRDNKRVLLQFGANWCIWCHRMHDQLAQDKELARKMLYEYEFVLIDVDEVDGKKHNEAVNARYGRPTKHGLPVWVVLDAAGRQLTTIQTEPFEVGDGYDSGKVLAALDRWKAKPAVAREVLASAIAQAKSQSKNVFLHFGAPWCGSCKKFDAYLSSTEVAAAFGTAFVPVKIDVERMTGGQELAARHGQTEDDGIPFFVILDADGKKLADSRGEKGNVGFPVEPFEIEHFMNVIKEAGKKLSASQLAALETALKGKS